MRHVGCSLHGRTRSQTSVLNLLLGLPLEKKLLKTKRRSNSGNGGGARVVVICEGKKKVAFHNVGERTITSVGPIVVHLGIMS